MSSAPQTRSQSRFACTQCGACCNRSPEVELSEAAALSDVFVFRLMFRHYELPRTLSGYLATRIETAGSGELFYESKRLLAAFSARTNSATRRHDGKAIEYRKYLTISALTLDTGSGACTALSNGKCGIYERRPLACRTVPFHYSRPEALAETDLETFVGTPGYECDTTIGAPVVLEAGWIVDAQSRLARNDALGLAERDRCWQREILRRLTAGSRNCSLPSLREIEVNAAFGATTMSMRVAWQIAAESGAISAETCRTLIAAQAAVIDRELAAARCTSATRETLSEMRGEYRRLLND